MPSGPSSPTATRASFIAASAVRRAWPSRETADIYVAASLHGRRGVVRVTAAGEAKLVLSGTNIVGLAFSPLGTAILATNEAVYDLDLGVEGQNLF